MRCESARNSQLLAKISGFDTSTLRAFKILRLESEVLFNAKRLVGFDEVLVEYLSVIPVFL